MIRALFLCTGNSARSILGEFLLRALDPERFATWSAGSHPTGKVNPFALRELKERGLDASGATSKSWQTLTEIPFELVITVCDHARESCPLWPVGRPATLHWGLPDPAAVEGSDEDKARAFAATARELDRRLRLLAALPLETSSHAEIELAGQRIAES